MTSHWCSACDLESRRESRKKSYLDDNFEVLYFAFNMTCH